MKAKDIKAGATYRNSGAGRTERRVIGVGRDFRPSHVVGIYEDKDDVPPGVEFQQRDLLAVRFPGWRRPRRVWLREFAAWAGSEVTE